MKSISLLVLLAAFGAAPLHAQSEPPPLKPMLATITEKDCRERVEILAGPQMAGRYTGSPGFERAAVYVEEQLTAFGLEPMGEEEGSFRREYSLDCLVAGPKTTLSWDRGLEAPELELMKDFLPVPGSTQASVSGEAVFVGYAIDAPKEKWRDLKKKDVEGKIVFAFTREPRADDPKEKKFDGVASTSHSSLSSKARAVKEAGGLALVLVPDPGAEAEPDALMSGMLPLVRQEAARMERQLGGDLPMMMITRELAGSLFDTDLDAYHASIDKKRRPALLEAPGITLSLNVEFKSAPRNAMNLAARIKGSGESGKVLIVGAHLDHVGLDLLNGEFLGRAHIFPGADDNASGSSTLLEVAEALSGTTPEIDILFLWFSGEELGLLGSAAYCRDPVYPHESTIAMFNMDMVGRGEAKELNIGGLWKQPALAKIVTASNKRSRSGLKLDLKAGKDLYARSDQYSFYEKGIPALFFFEGDLNSNKVYHKPGDVPATMDAMKMSRIGKCFTACVYAVAYEGERP